MYCTVVLGATQYVALSQPLLGDLVCVMAQNPYYIDCRLRNTPSISPVIVMILLLLQWNGRSSPKPLTFFHLQPIHLRKKFQDRATKYPSQSDWWNLSLTVWALNLGRVFPWHDMEEWVGWGSKDGSWLLVVAKTIPVGLPQVHYGDHWSFAEAPSSIQWHPRELKLSICSQTKTN